MEDRAIIYDGNETFPVTREQAEALEYFRLIRYSPEDGPNGIMYRPAPGISLDRVKDSLVPSKQSER